MDFENTLKEMQCEFNAKREELFTTIENLKKSEVAILESFNSQYDKILGSIKSEMNTVNTVIANLWSNVPGFLNYHSYSSGITSLKGFTNLILW